MVLVCHVIHIYCCCCVVDVHYFVVIACLCLCTMQHFLHRKVKGEKNKKSVPLACSLLGKTL